MGLGFERAGRLLAAHVGAHVDVAQPVDLTSADHLELLLHDDVGEVGSLLGAGHHAPG